MKKTVEEILSYRDGINIAARVSDTYFFTREQDGQLSVIVWVLSKNGQSKETRSVEELKAYRDGIKTQYGGKQNEYSERQQGMFKAIDWILGEKEA
jgi:hypothetical protein